MNILPIPSSYKPAMTFKTKCLYCGQTITAIGHPAFTKACDDHREKCPAPAAAPPPGGEPQTRGEEHK